MVHYLAGNGYVHLDGTPYAGAVQNRYVMLYDGKVTDALTTAELTGRNGNHNWRQGLNQWYNHTNLTTAELL